MSDRSASALASHHAADGARDFLVAGLHADELLGGRGDHLLDGALQAGERRRLGRGDARLGLLGRSEEHTSELQSLMRISYAVFCLKKKKHDKKQQKDADN